MAPATRMAIERKQESDKGNDVIEMDMLPNEIVNMCLAELSARDLLHMEMINHRLRDLVLQNNNLWKDKVKLRWGMQANNSLLEGWTGCIVSQQLLIG